MAQIWYTDFTSSAGWSLDSAMVWEIGGPGQTPPGTAYDGSNVLATDLDANYPDDVGTPSWATSPVIDCSNYENVVLSFRRHAYFENNTDYDTFTVEVYDGDAWQEIWTSDDTPADINDSSWTLQNPSISDYGDGNADFQIRFSGRSDGNTNYRGWFIDAIGVSGDIVTNYLIEGKTYNYNGDELSGCNLLLVKDNLDDTFTVIDYTTSNVSADYQFSAVPDTDAQYQVYAWKDDSPHVMDVTDHIVSAAESPTESYDLYLWSDSQKGETSPDKDLRLRSESDKTDIEPVPILLPLPQVVFNYRQRRV